MLVMFGRSSKNIRLIAFLLPLSFVWSWAACSLLCSEIVERHHLQTVSDAESSDGNQLHALDLDGCPFTASTAVLESRQNVNAPAPLIANASAIIRRECLFILPSIHESDLNQNSPPRNSLGP